MNRWLPLIIVIVLVIIFAILAISFDKEVSIMRNMSLDKFSKEELAIASLVGTYMEDLEMYSAYILTLPSEEWEIYIRYRLEILAIADSLANLLVSVFAGLAFLIGLFGIPLSIFYLTEWEQQTFCDRNKA